MEAILTLLIPGLLTVLLIRAMVLPVRLGLKLALHSGCGFVCLWLVNLSAPVTGITLPVNAVTVITAGILGLPGIGLTAVLAAM